MAHIVVIAPDSFKGTIGAASAADALAAGWRRERPGDHARLLPMADGGEGTVDAFATAVPGARRMPV
ncbi:glycerate kinase, partial [Microbacterium arthrosphaerae]